MYLYLFIAKVSIRYINFYANIERYIYIFFLLLYYTPCLPFLTTRGCNIVVIPVFYAPLGGNIGGGKVKT